MPQPRACAAAQTSLNTRQSLLPGFGRWAGRCTHARGPVCRATGAKGADGKDGKSGSGSDDDSAPLELRLPSQRAANPVERTKYRRSKPTAEEREATQKRKLMLWTEEQGSGAAAKPPTSSPAAARTGPRIPPVMLIDGYNVINAISELQSLVRRASLQAARQELQAWVAHYAARKRLLAVIVYDAQSAAGPSRREQLSPRVMVQYSTACEADTLIIRSAEKWVRRGATNVAVVSGDRRIQEAVTSRDFLSYPMEVRAVVEDMCAGYRAGLGPEGGGLGPSLRAAQPQLRPGSSGGAAAAAADDRPLGELEVPLSEQLARIIQDSANGSAAADAADCDNAESGFEAFFDSSDDDDDDDDDDSGCAVEPRAGGKGESPSADPSPRSSFGPSLNDLFSTSLDKLVGDVLK